MSTLSTVPGPRPFLTLLVPDPLVFDDCVFSVPTNPHHHPPPRPVTHPPTTPRPPYHPPVPLTTLPFPLSPVPSGPPSPPVPPTPPVPRHPPTPRPPVTPPPPRPPATRPSVSDLDLSLLSFPYERVSSSVRCSHTLHVTRVHGSNDVIQREGTYPSSPTGPDMSKRHFLTVRGSSENRIKNCSKLTCERCHRRDRRCFPFFFIFTIGGLTRHDPSIVVL